MLNLLVTENLFPVFLKTNVISLKEYVEGVFIALVRYIGVVKELLQVTFRIDIKFQEE